MVRKRDIVDDQLSGQRSDHQTDLWGELAGNAVALETTPDQRPRLLRQRAVLWDRLAAVSTPACQQVYLDAAAKCRAEADEADELRFDTEVAG